MHLDVPEVLAFGVSTTILLVALGYGIVASRLAVAA
jgi:hypothetical protein